ncbi:hypothetical protein AX14_002028 [Amanita brunnescens Koide BX004]|nr:hypothetical protein AX14_002028 [Amanita brunnescens Koide BX004]
MSAVDAVNEVSDMSDTLGAFAFNSTFVVDALGEGSRTSRIKKIPQSGSSGDINVTNDGATIKILVNISKVQDDEVGDGPTSVCAGGGMSEGGGEGDKLEISSADNRGRELWSADFEGVEGLSVAEGELARTFDQPELDDVI